jgi:hypothetical protein
MFESLAFTQCVDITTVDAHNSICRGGTEAVQQSVGL